MGQVSPGFGADRHEAFLYGMCQQLGKKSGATVQDGFIYHVDGYPYLQFSIQDVAYLTCDCAFTRAYLEKLGYQSSETLVSIPDTYTYQGMTDAKNKEGVFSKKYRFMVSILGGPLKRQSWDKMDEWLRSKNFIDYSMLRSVCEEVYMSNPLFKAQVSLDDDKYIKMLIDLYNGVSKAWGGQYNSQNQETVYAVFGASANEMSMLQKRNR